MKRTYLVSVREPEGQGYTAFVRAKDKIEAANIDGVEMVHSRLTPKEKAKFVEEQGIEQWATNPEDR